MKFAEGSSTGGGFSGECGPVFRVRISPFTSTDLSNNGLDMYSSRMIIVHCVHPLLASNKCP